MPSPTPVKFRNREGLELFGTLHRSDIEDRSKPFAILLSPGVKMRVGPGRLYIPVTKLLNELGFSVLRFDFYGLGDSEGELEEELLADVYNNIEVGRYVDDSIAAMDYVAHEIGATHFLLGGLCGGAITGLLTAQCDSRVTALLSIGMTVTLASNSATPAKYLTQNELATLRSGYLSKVLDIGSWARLLTFKSDYSALYRSLAQPFRRSVKLSEKNKPPEEQRGDVNPLFPKAYLDFLNRGGKALMIFSGADRLYGQYQEKFLAYHKQELDQVSDQIVEYVIPDANHVVSFGKWREELLSRTSAWLDTV